MRRRRVRSARGRGSPPGRREGGGGRSRASRHHQLWRLGPGRAAASGLRARESSPCTRAAADGHEDGLGVSGEVGSRHVMRRRRRRERGQGRQVERSGPGRCATRAGGPARKAAPEPPAATAGGPGLHPDRACEQREMREGGAEAGGQRREGGLARMGANAGLAALR
ncbi:unnamed protein product [Prorocentrum cordatum]|uniref:Uncharacterized protein n=1 Tax=Prorocentrum cordatum TaxID=2364126 RepID=A0ABN9R4Y3_9DINO|nr:unnamed protein product [Polarella glacialis]